ncbi:MAG: amidohydrolase family protein [Calditrichota bacterium]
MTDRLFHVGYLYDGERLYHDSEVFVRDGRIHAILCRNDSNRDAQAVRRLFDAAEQIDLPGGFLLPGLINSHHHAYSALARGMPLNQSFPNFPAILEGLWWRLDEVLDEDAVRISALVTALDSIRHGCTIVLDHHSSPHFVRGSLDVIAHAFNRLNMTAALCYETTDRNGPEAFREAAEENLRFYHANRDHNLRRGMFGLHASFTLSDDSLQEIARVKPEAMPIHVHVAEDTSDVEDAHARGYAGPFARLQQFGLWNETSLAVHGVHMSSDERTMAKEIGVGVVHNPESNCNNRVGYADPAAFRNDRILLGTDGMSSDMIASLRSAYLLQAAYGNPDVDRMALAHQLLFRNPAQFVARLFGREVGTLRVGASADFAIFRYPSPTPVTADNWLSHFIFGLANRSEAAWVYANGEAVLENGAFATVDEVDILAEARSIADHLWKRFQAHARGSR